MSDSRTVRTPRTVPLQAHGTISAEQDGLAMIKNHKCCLVSVAVVARECVASTNSQRTCACGCMCARASVLACVTDRTLCLRALHVPSGAAERPLTRLDDALRRGQYVIVRERTQLVAAGAVRAKRTGSARVPGPEGAILSGLQRGSAHVRAWRGESGALLDISNAVILRHTGARVRRAGRRDDGAIPVALKAQRAVRRRATEGTGDAVGRVHEAFVIANLCGIHQMHRTG